MRAKLATEPDASDEARVLNHIDEPEHVEHGQLERFDLIRIGITAIASALVWFRVWEPFCAHKPARDRSSLVWRMADL